MQGDRLETSESSDAVYPDSGRWWPRFLGPPGFGDALRDASLAEEALAFFEELATRRVER
jgi:hypothetical protein